MTEFQKKILKEYSAFIWPKPVLKNDCIDNKKNSTTSSTKIVLNPTQQFIGKYIKPSNNNGILLWHSVGSGKTLSAVNILSQFEKEGYNTLWVTRTTLKKDLTKALDMLPLKKSLMTISYKQFSNIGKSKGELHAKLVQRAKKINPATTDPLYKTIVIIDEAHKLYTKDLKPQEMHDISKIQDMIHKSYSKSGKDKTMIVLMSATPITESPLEVIQLFNLIITSPSDRFNVNNFKNEYLSSDGEFLEKTKKNFQNKIKELVSYIDMSKDPRRFTQVNYNEILVPLSTPTFNSNFDNREFLCKEGTKLCKEIFDKETCKEQEKECKNNIKNDKKLLKNGKYQDKMLKEKCFIDI